MIFQISISLFYLCIFCSANAKIVVKEIDRNKPLFLTDCQRYGDYTKQECEKIWDERSNPPKED